MLLNFVVDCELNREISDFIFVETMSTVFEGYERQYCELSSKLSKLCTAAAALNGGN